MDLELRFKEKYFDVTATGRTIMNLVKIDDALTIAREYAEKRYKQAQYDLVVMIAQDMFNVGALSADLEYLAKLKKQLKGQLATEAQDGK